MVFKEALSGGTVMPDFDRVLQEQFDREGFVVVRMLDPDAAGALAGDCDAIAGSAASSALNAR